MNFFKTLILSLVLVASALAAPDKKITEIVIPWATGGTAANLGNILNEALGENDIPSVVVYKPGAESVIGANYAARGATDGTTLFLGSTSTLVGNTVFRPTGMEYSADSFVPIIPLGATGHVLVVPANSPIKNYQQFKFYVRANPEKFNMGLSAPSLAPLWKEWARREQLPEPNLIPYKGSAAVTTDLLGGQLLVMQDNWTSTSVFLDAKRVRVIAAINDTVLQQVKSVDPASEAVSISAVQPGLNFNIWFGLYAPTGTPKVTLDRINQILNRTFQQPKYREKLAATKLSGFGGPADALNKMQKTDTKTLHNIVNKNSGG